MAVVAKGKAVTDLLAQFESKLIVGHEDGHWSLDTFVNNKGYHTISVGGGRKKYGHVLSHELFIGRVPEGWDVDHQCNVTWCCNPVHLKAMTRSENLRRAYEVCGAKLHDMTNPDNYYQRKNGGRLCKPCNHRRNKERSGKR